MCRAWGAAARRKAAAGHSEELVSRTIGAVGFTRSGVLPWADDVPTVHDVLTRAEVDSKRLGCVGQSVGGAGRPRQGSAGTPWGRAPAHAANASGPRLPSFLGAPRVLIW
jgi:hypothetical protein